ncbi:hypothetical protein B0T20DRAFT_489001 [Sordaria brevicollis]|uniref:Uncharacterized protein n=1 Tax=Sordaria brevicollis TaxID=83679 RepID=A0AAE0U5S4_SORBR|nr:hypothetical protein B0T20DRAFT_489001 [Sordaria brevicollis]
MPSIGVIEIRFLPRFQAPRVSPWFILWGVLLSALLWSSISSYVFPSLYDGTSNIGNILGHIKSASLRHNVVEPYRIAGPFDLHNADSDAHDPRVVGVVPRAQLSEEYTTLASPTIIATTAPDSMMASNTISTTDVAIKPFITARPGHRVIRLTLHNNLPKAYFHSDGDFDEDLDKDSVRYE